jgi:uncharacterized protein YigE (DUF2233 family)
VDYEGGRYHLYRVDKADWSRLQLAWLGENGQPLGDFNGLRRQLAARNKQIIFATNACATPWVCGRRTGRSFLR